MAGPYRIRATSGTVLRRIFSLYNQDKTPRDLTDYRAMLRVKRERTDTTFVFIASDENGLLRFDTPRANGRLVLEVPSEKLPAVGAYIYDLRLQEPMPSGQWLPPYLEGTFTVRRGLL